MTRQEVKEFVQKACPNPRQNGIQPPLQTKPHFNALSVTITQGDHNIY
jgi:hypothetical protein